MLVGLLEPLGKLVGVIGEDEAGAGAFEGVHGLQHRPFFIDPAVLGGSLEHRVFTGDLIRGSGDGDGVGDCPENIQISNARV